MRLKEGFITHESNGEHFTVSNGSNGFHGLIRSNKTAGFIVACLKTETTEDAIIDRMLEKYDAPREVIAADVRKIIDELRRVGAMEEEEESTPLV